jgi:hypothetical protein
VGVRPSCAFFAGETFLDLPDAQRRAEQWCTSTAGLRVHGTTYQRPGEQFVAEELQLLLPVPGSRLAAYQRSLVDKRRRTPKRPTTVTSA